MYSIENVVSRHVFIYHLVVKKSVRGKEENIETGTLLTVSMNFIQGINAVEEIREARLSKI
jgi:hypothetical protein